jgi:hypothetical protein
MISWTYLSLGLPEETVTCLSPPKKRALLYGSPLIINQTSHVLLTMLTNMGEMDLGESVPSARGAPAFRLITTPSGVGEIRVAFLKNIKYPVTFNAPFSTITW